MYIISDIFSLSSLVMNIVRQKTVIVLHISDLDSVINNQKFGPGPETSRYIAPEGVSLMPGA